MTYIALLFNCDILSREDFNSEILHTVVIVDVEQRNSVFVVDILYGLDACTNKQDNVL